MDILLVVIFVFCLCGLKFRGKGYNPDYISKEQCTMINGIFVIFVFLRHFLENDPDIAGSYLINLINSYSHQLIVTPFLFFSGYGIMASIIKQDKKYIDSMPVNRILRTWCHFAIAVIIYMLLNLLLKRKYCILDNILAFTGWTSIGNSNWYVFAILFLYIITFASFYTSYVNSYILKNRQMDSIKKKRRMYKTMICLIVIACIIYICVMKFINENIIWYNTILLYPAGMVFALNKKTFENFMQKSQKRYIISTVTIGAVLLLSFGVFALFLSYNKNIYIFQFIGVLLVLFIIAISMKFSLNSKALKFLGNHIFDIYIMQRIPISIFREHISNMYFSFILTSLVTLALAILFQKILNSFDNMVKFNSSNKLKS